MNTGANLPSSIPCKDCPSQYLLQAKPKDSRLLEKRNTQLTQRCDAKYTALEEYAITTKHTTDWRKTS